MCVTRIKYSNTVINWSTLFETYFFFKRDTLPRPLLVASLPCCFPISHFLQLSSLQVPKDGPDSHYVYVGGCSLEKIPTGASFIPDDFLILYPVYMMTGSFNISLFECTLHINKLNAWFKIANITHALPVPVHRHTDFPPKHVVVSRLHDTVARFRARVKFSPRYNNRGDLTPRQHDILWWYHVNKCRAMRGNRSELAPGRKSSRCHVNTPLERVNWISFSVKF